MRRSLRTAIVWTLVVSMTLAPSIVFAQDAEKSNDAASAAKKSAAVKPALGYITPTAFAAVVAFPNRVLTSPTAELAPTEVISAAGLKEWGIDPVKIEQVVVVVEPPLAGPPAIGVALTMTKPIGDAKIFPQLVEKTESADLNGKKYQKGKTPMDFSVYHDGRTIIVAPDSLLLAMLKNNVEPVEGKLSKALGRIETPPDILAMVWLEPVRPMIAAAMAQSQNAPQFADLNKAPDLISAVGLKANLSESLDLSLTIHANDEAAAKELGKIIDKSLLMAKQMSMMSTAPMAMSDDPVQQAQAKYSARMADRMTKALRPVRKGKNLTLAVDLANSPQTQIATIGIMMSLLLPAVQAARAAAQRIQAEKAKVGDGKIPLEK